MNLVKFDENNYNVINTVYVHLFFYIGQCCHGLEFPKIRAEVELAPELCSLCYAC